MAFLVIWTCFGPSEGAADVAREIEKPEAEQGNVNAKYRVTRETLVQKI